MANLAYNGILNVYKPSDMTSFDVVAILRKTLKIKKIGHTGTLDPMAVGVLPVCLGNATKAVEFLMNKDKVYRVELTLGIDTNTQDATGDIIKKQDVFATEGEIKEAIMSFVGNYKQVPPMFSAIKVNGKKLYQLAREGITIDRESREVTIYWIKIDKFDENYKVIFDIACSKGTYIRTLCYDIGTKLGCGGHMSSLIRINSGGFDINESKTLEEIKKTHENNQLRELIIDVDKVFLEYKKMTLNFNEEKKYLNGALVKLNENRYKEGSLFRIYNDRNEFLGLGEIRVIENTLYLKSRKLFL